MRINPDAVILFAAGFGTRMGALTQGRPKPLIKVGGQALLDHALDLVNDAGVARVVVNTHYLAEQIQGHLSDHPNVAISHETETILETGGGLKNAAHLLGPGPVFTLNTDAVWTGKNPFSTLLSAWRPDAMDALLLLVPAENAIGHSGGDFVMNSDGRLTRGDGLVYTGAQIINADIVVRRPERIFSLNSVWNEIAQKGRLSGVVHVGGWCDVGRPESIPLAETLLSGTSDV